MTPLGMGMSVTVKFHIETQKCAKELIKLFVKYDHFKLQILNVNFNHFGIDSPPLYLANSCSRRQAYDVLSSGELIPAKVALNETRGLFHKGLRTILSLISIG